jgi:hypothetical protein
MIIKSYDYEMINISAYLLISIDLSKLCLHPPKSKNTMSGFKPPSRMYDFDEEGMTFYVTFTLRAERVQRWIRRVKEKYLDDAPTKCIDWTASSPS